MKLFENPLPLQFLSKQEISKQDIVTSVKTKLA